MKVSPEVRRLAKYKKKKEFSVATLQFDVTFCTQIPCAPSVYSIIEREKANLSNELFLLLRGVITY